MKHRIQSNLAILLSILAFLFVCETANAEDKSIVFKNIEIDTNSFFNNKRQIKVKFATSISGYINNKLDCRLFIYDSNKDFLKTRNSNYNYGSGYYSNMFSITPIYPVSDFNEMWFYIDPDDLVLTTSDYQIAIFFMDPITGKSIQNGLGLKDFHYSAVKSSVATNSSSTTTSNSASQAKTDLAAGTYYYQSSKTGEVELANIVNVEEKYGGGKTLNGFGHLFTYIGMVNGRVKWSTYTIEFVYEDTYIQGFGQPIKITKGSRRVPNNDCVIFTAPDMSAVYTITDTFDKRISRDTWTSLYKAPSTTAPNSGGNYNNGDINKNSRSEYLDYNKSGYAQCRHCHGTGRCSTCNGTGDRADTHNREPGKVVWRCTTCSGSGKCMFCNGVGKVRN